VIEISKDASKWDEADRRENDSSLKSRNLTQFFKVSRLLEFRLARLRQVGKNHSSSLDDRLLISGFEIFGSLREIRLCDCEQTSLHLIACSVPFR
jgi:hypothetical protein